MKELVNDDRRYPLTPRLAALLECITMQQESERMMQLYENLALNCERICVPPIFTVEMPGAGNRVKGLRVVHSMEAAKPTSLIEFIVGLFSRKGRG